MRTHRVTTTPATNELYEKHVPIIHFNEGSSNVFRVYLTAPIEEAFEYNELLEVFDAAKDGDKIYLILNTPGGYVHTAKAILAGIYNTNATVIGVCMGAVASVGTIIALQCDELIIMPHTHFMIHQYSGGVIGKGQEIYAQVEFDKKHLTQFYGEVYDTFLTPSEIERVVYGQDIYLDVDEILKRWALVQEARQTEAEAYEQQQQIENLELLAKHLMENGYYVDRPKTETSLTVVEEDSTTPITEDEQPKSKAHTKKKT